MEKVNTPILFDLTNLFNITKALVATDTQKALREFQALISLAKKQQNYGLQIDSEIELTKLYRRQGFFYKALRQGGIALQLINKHFPDDKKRMALCFKELGVIYVDGLRKYSIGLDYFLKAIKCNVSELNATLFNNIGSLYIDSKHYDKAIVYLEKGRKLVIQENNSTIHIFILENLGRCYIAQYQYKKAEAILQKALGVANKGIVIDQSIHYIRGFTLNTLAGLYIKMNKPSKAIRLIDEAFKFAVEKNHLSIIVESLKNKGAYALKTKNENLFLESIHQAVEYTENQDLINEKESCLQILKNYYWEKQNFQKACLVADQIIQLRNELDETHENASMVNVLEQQESEILHLETNNRKIQQQKEELQQLTYIVSHDLKEPLRNIGSYSGLIKRRYESVMDKEGKEFLNFIIINTSHMYKMLDDLLHYSTLKNENDTNNFADPNIILKDISYRLKNIIQSSETTLLIGDLPIVRMRPIQLDIIFDNLIRNAIKFRSPIRKLCIEITAKVLSKEDKVRFSIKDNGIGIASTYHESVFQIFKRLDKINFTGTGIGLSICKKMVESYSGEIWIESTLDEGSTFFFTLIQK